MSAPSEFIQLSSNSKSLRQSDSPSLDSLKKIEAKLNKLLKNGGDNSKAFNKIIKINNSKTPYTSQVRRAVVEHSIKSKVSMSDEIIDLNNIDSSDEDNLHNQFDRCKYKHCDLLACKSGASISDLYCTYICKNLDAKQKITKKKHLINEPSNPSKKSTIDQKHLFTKLENRINKRKQLLTISCPEDTVEWIDVNGLINLSEKLPIEKNRSLQQSLLPISSPETEDDDDENNYYFDLKHFIKDKDVLNYMMNLQLRSAPQKMFDRPFPTEKNLFVAGQKLEGIDPKHEALFCVMTVSEVCGYRIKLHFDGYREDYDFWVNADCPDLFHSGWCETNLRILQPPNNYANKFDWNDYLRECQALSAPKINFVSTKNLNSCKNRHKFHIGGKLEALYKLTRTLPKQLICVATVADILGNRVRIHFDGQTDDFDYWTDIASINIHPIKWCDKYGRTLSPPSGYNDMKGKKPFNWTEYLKETNSEPVPEDAFIRRPLRDFSRGMIVEVVDLVVPRLLRTAKVVDVRGDELKIVYDGFDNDYAYWVEDDSPDIHPVGWSSRTNHPIELPPASGTLWSCNIIGCKGYGNSSDSLKTNHTKIEDCPYEIYSWKKAVAGSITTSDRLNAHNVLITTTLTSSKIKSNVHQNDKIEKKNRINSKKKNLVNIKGKTNQKRKHCQLNANNIGPEYDTDIKKSQFENEGTLNKFDRKTLGVSILVGHNALSKSLNLSHFWTKLGKPLFDTTDIEKWSVQKVASYVQAVVECYNFDIDTDENISLPDRFKNQKIDGNSFLKLTREDIMKKMKIPLSKAYLLANIIEMLRKQSADQ